MSGLDVNRNPITFEATIASIPEPASLVLLGIGLAGMTAKVRRRFIRPK